MLRRSALVALFLSSAVIATAGPPSAGRLAAAEELLVTMKMDKQLQASMDAMLDAQTKGNPAMVRMRKPMAKFFGKYMSWEALKEETVRNYADSFSEAELKELTAFYKSPIGQKLIDRTPELTRKGAETGMKRVKDHQAELQQMIQQELQQPQD